MVSRSPNRRESPYPWRVCVSSLRSTPILETWQYLTFQVDPKVHMCNYHAIWRTAEPPCLSSSAAIKSLQSVAQYVALLTQPCVTDRWWFYVSLYSKKPSPRRVPLPLQHRQPFSPIRLRYPASCSAQRTYRSPLLDLVMFPRTTSMFRSRMPFYCSNKFSSLWEKWRE